MTPRWVSLLLYALWGAVVAYLLSFLDRGWLPPEEGTLAQAAERVLWGELPHRDFDGMYSGGLELFHALAFRVFGTRLISLRIAVFLVFLPTIPLIYRMGRTLAGRVATTIGVLLALAWGLPNYTSAMPSWYNLFLAFYCTAALFEFLENGRRRWLFAAGIAVGLSVAVKTVGLYLLAAVFLSLIVHEQRLAADDASSGADTPAVRGWGYAAFILSGLVLFVALVLWVFAGPSGPSGYYHFVLPPILLAAYAASAELDGRGRGESVPRARRLASWLVPLGAGLLLPILGLLLPYVVSGDLAVLWTGWVTTPLTRLDTLVRDPPALATLWTLIPVILVLVLGGVGGTSWSRRIALGLVVLGLALVWVMGANQLVFRPVWWSMLAFGPLVTVLGLGSLLNGRSAVRSPEVGLKRDRIFALVAVAGMVSLVQFPMSAPFYFFYSAPMVAMAALATVSTWSGPRRFGAAALAIFFIMFAGRWSHTGYIYQMADRYAAHPELLPLGLERSGLRVAESEAREFHVLVEKIRERARGDHIYATPDSPVVYFLSGKKNPTPTFYDFMGESEGRVGRVLAALDRHDINLVVINAGPLPISPPPEPALRSELASRYPYQEQVGRFVLMWRDAESDG